MAIDIYCCTKIVTREWAGATVLCLFLVFALRSHAVFALAGRLAATILSGSGIPAICSKSSHCLANSLLLPSNPSDQIDCLEETALLEPAPPPRYLHDLDLTTLTDASGPAFFAFFGGFLRPTDKTSTTRQSRSDHPILRLLHLCRNRKKDPARVHQNFARHPREQRDL